MIPDAVAALARLRRAYVSYLDRPDELKWRRCVQAHTAVVAALDEAAMTQLSALISAQVDSGNGTPSAAAERLDELTKSGAEAVERRLSSRIGFRERELNGFVPAARAAARNAADRGQASEAPRDAERMVESLIALRNRIHRTILDTQPEGRRRKAAHRNDAKEYASAQLYMVGSIVLNAQELDMFDASYAISVGMASVRPRRRSHLRTPTHLRPSEDVEEAA